MVNSNDKLGGIESVYKLDSVAHQIDRATASNFGRLLVENGYRMEFGATIRVSSDLTLRSILKIIDHGVSYHRSIEEDLETGGRVLGPYYSQGDFDEFCPEGVAVWIPTNQPE